MMISVGAVPALATTLVGVLSVCNGIGRILTGAAYDAFGRKITMIGSGVLTILAAGIIVPALPYLLGFAAGAMLYVVTAELIPDVAKSGHPHTGNIMFAMGFTLMMALDVAFGG